jgi:hypothetical protein
MWYIARPDTAADVSSSSRGSGSSSSWSNSSSSFAEITALRANNFSFKVIVK